MLGQHTAEALAEPGHRTGEIAAMAEAGIVASVYRRQAEHLSADHLAHLPWLTVRERAITRTPDSVQPGSSQVKAGFQLTAAT
jgi:hypothetical protein